MIRKPRNRDDRRHQRYARTATARLDFHDGAGLHWATTMDVSREGAKFRADSPTPSDCLVVLFLALEGGAFPLEAKGRVCWSEPLHGGGSCFGVRFLDLSEDESNLLEGFLHDGNSLRPVGV